MIQSRYHFGVFRTEFVDQRINLFAERLAPAGTPPAIVAKLNAAINKVLTTPELRNAILTLSAQPKGGTSDAFAKLIAAEVPKWAGVIQLSGTRAY